MPPLIYKLILLSKIERVDFRRKVLLSNSVVFPKSYFKYITPHKAVKRFLLLLTQSDGSLFLFTPPKTPFVKGDPNECEGEPR